MLVRPLLQIPRKRTLIIDQKTNLSALERYGKSFFSKRTSLLISTSPPITFYSLVASGRVKPVTYSTTYTLENLAEGLKAIEQRKTWGKAIVQVREEGNGRPKSKL